MRLALGDANDRELAAYMAAARPVRRTPQARSRGRYRHRVRANGPLSATI